MVLSIISIILNVAFFVILNLDLYTDKAHMADGSVRTWQRSPLDRLDVADKRWMLYLQIFFAAVSVITGIMIIAGVRNNAVKITRLVATIASAVMFMVILIVSKGIHPKY